MIGFLLGFSLEATFKFFWSDKELLKAIYHELFGLRIDFSEIRIRNAFLKFW